jgi:hypothetical protein
LPAVVVNEANVIAPSQAVRAAIDAFARDGVNAVSVDTVDVMNPADGMKTIEKGGWGFLQKSEVGPGLIFGLSPQSRPHARNPGQARTLKA